MVFRGISIWRTVGIRGDQEVVVDLLLADSEYLRTALARRRMVRFGTLQVPILTIEDLIVLKTLARRLQDLADLEESVLGRDELRVDGAMSRNGKQDSILVDSSLSYRCEYQRKPFCSVKVVWGGAAGLFEEQDFEVDQTEPGRIGNVVVVTAL